MILLRVLRPVDVPNRKSNWGYKVSFYHWLLLRLQPLYKKSAISDTLNFGETQVIHNVRDYWYEQELQRFHIDTAQHLEHQNTPYNVKRKNRRSVFFNWSESLLVFHNGKSYNIKRSDIFSIETELDGLLNISGAKDFMLRSEFVLKVATPRNSSAGEETITATVSEKSKGEQSRQHILVKDAISPSFVESRTGKVKYQGFEENNIF